jgi:hypothetical protein
MLRQLGSSVTFRKISFGARCSCCLSESLYHMAGKGLESAHALDFFRRVRGFTWIIVAVLRIRKHRATKDEQENHPEYLPALSHRCLLEVHLLD